MKQKIHGAEWLYISLLVLFSLNNHCPGEKNRQETMLKFQTVVGIWRPRYMYVWFNKTALMIYPVFVSPWIVLGRSARMLLSRINVAVTWSYWRLLSKHIWPFVLLIKSKNSKRPNGLPCVQARHPTFTVPHKILSLKTDLYKWVIVTKLSTWQTTQKISILRQ